MNQPPLEVADIVRAQGNRFIENNRRWIRALHCKVLRAIAQCRTAALGGHRDQCPRCGHCAISYDLLFRASAETLLQVAADPKHLGAQIGFPSVLHTWGQNLLHHPHIHCVIPSGGLSPDHSRWIHPRYPFFLPVAVLRRVFRGKFVAGLKRRFQQGQLTFHGALKPLENEKAFHAFLRPLFSKSGSFMRNGLSADRTTCWLIWPATPIVWRSVTTASWPLRTTKSLSAGKSTLTEIGKKG